jgi:hypothetical protein
LSLLPVLDGGVKSLALSYLVDDDVIALRARKACCVIRLEDEVDALDKVVMIIFGLGVVVVPVVGYGR